MREGHHVSDRRTKFKLRGRLEIEYHRQKSIKPAVAPTGRDTGMIRDDWGDCEEKMQVMIPKDCGVRNSLIYTLYTLGITYIFKHYR